MRPTAVDRRRFLVGAIFLGSSAGALKQISAWAQGGPGATLVRMARHLYPHDALDDAVYAQVLDDALGATAADTSLADAFRSAESELDARSESGFLDLTADEQLATMQTFEDSEFFAAIATAVRIRLYNHPAFWSLIGYEGPSWQRGGYLNRGAGEIDWLPGDR
jgi:hypothetical protein